MILAVNKADNESRRQAALEFYELALGDPYPISALHGTGTGDLLDAIVEQIPKCRRNRRPTRCGSRSWAGRTWASRRC